jgi:hypothetical protein
MARNLLNAVARYEQVEICLSPLDQGFAEVLPGARLRARSEVGFGSSDMIALGFLIRWRRSGPSEAARGAGQSRDNGQRLKPALPATNSA